MRGANLGIILVKLSSLIVADWRESRSNIRSQFKIQMSCTFYIEHMYVVNINANNIILMLYAHSI